MARGQKYNDDVKEKALALLAINNNATYVAKELGLPYSTVKTWESRMLEHGADEEGSLENLREKNKQRFVNDAWRMIDKSMKLMDRRLTRAMEHEDFFDELLCLISSEADLTRDELRTISNRISSMKIDNLKELAVVFGTMYDKHALAQGDPTENIGGKLSIMKFEDL